MQRRTWATIAILFCITTTNVSAHMPAKAKETLRGLPGVAVVIEPLHPTTERDGLKQSQLLTEVEQQLKDAGIRVLTQEEWKTTPGAPYLYVNVAALKKSYGLYAYAIEVCLNQVVTLIRDQHLQEFAETWETREVGTGGAYLTLTAEPTEQLTVTAAGRFDTTALKINDRLATKGDEERTNNASGSHRFERFNPAIGATYSLLPNLNLYANYSESYRAPTAIELTCANPEAPCPIPTAIVDDPPLKPVKGKTWETGLRWSPFPQLHTILAFFRTDLEDDILFRNDPQSRVLGFFQNVQATRRQGIEFLLKGVWGRGQWFLNYTLTDATFETDADSLLLPTRR